MLRQPLKAMAVGVILASTGGGLTAQAADSLSIMEEVIVTAQKREQSAQDIGLAVASVSGRSLRDQNIVQPEDLAKIIPNVSSLNATGGGLPIIIVRGVGLQNFRVNDSPTTAIYIDEVYQSSIVPTDFSMYDLERVELLKGPQGGLYGRNSISGAMQVISNTPFVGEEATGFVNARYGQFNRRELEGGVSFPVSDSVAMRVAGRWEQSDDTQFRSTAGGFDHGEADRWAARTFLRFTPTDDVDLLFKVHGGADKSEHPLLRPVATWADLGTAADAGIPIRNAENLAVSVLSQTLCPSLLAGQGVNADCVTTTGLSLEDYGIGSGRNDKFDSASDFRNFADNEWAGASLNAAVTFDDYVFTSISALDTLTYRRAVDVDGLPIEYSLGDYNTDIDSWSQEFRLAYTGGDVISWVAGVSYAEDDLEEATMLAGSQGLLPVAFGGASFVTQNYDQSTEAFAIYGHGEWRFADNWNLVGELRYTNAEKTFEGEQLFGFDDGSFAPFLAPDDNASFNDVSGKLALEWSQSDAMLLYGSVSRGFKTGGFFGGFSTNPAQLASYDEETVLAWEAGFKSDWLDNRLRVNGSVFLYDRSDVQQSATDVSGSLAITRLTNIGDVEVSGAELDIVFQPFQRLSLMLGLGYVDSEIVDSDLVSATIPGMPASPIEGTNTPNYAKFSANFLGRYEQPITDTLDARLQLEYGYRSERDLNLVTNPLEAALLTEDGYGLTNLRLGLAPNNGSWDASVFVENLSDERYRTTLRDNGVRGMNTVFGDPRIWGVSVSYNFGS